MCIFSLYIGFKLGREFTTNTSTLVFNKLMENLVSKGFVTKDQFKEAFYASSYTLLKDLKSNKNTQ
jgi:hypothetical protein